jgi:hypothetical protein
VKGLLARSKSKNLDFTFPHLCRDRRKNLGVVVHSYAGRLPLPSADGKSQNQRNAESSRVMEIPSGSLLGASDSEGEAIKPASFPSWLRFCLTAALAHGFYCMQKILLGTFSSISKPITRKSCCRHAPLIVCRGENFLLEARCQGGVKACAWQ